MYNPQALFDVPDTPFQSWCIVVIALLVVVLVLVSIIRTEKQLNPRHAGLQGGPVRHGSKPDRR